tara:strand:- start:231 stop:425 length:195 start_codon:yes stop_codon:yes gene_type:complete
MWSKALLIRIGTSLPGLKKLREIATLQSVLQLLVSKKLVLHAQILTLISIFPKFLVDMTGSAKK